jgi:hypothetical protein
LYSNFSGDLILFKKYSLLFRNNNFENKEADIILNYHSIEKGMLFKNMKKGFAEYRIRNLHKILSNPDIIQIRKVFNTGDTEHRKNAALSWEDRVLRRMNVLKRNDCINDNITGSKFGKRGKRHTEETKQKISKSHKGKIKTQEHLSNISKAKLGIPNMKLRGRIRSDAHRENLRIANIGKVRSEESKRKTSQTLKITNQNPDVKRKRSIAAKNQKWTKEAIENRNKKLRGVPKSEEHKEKLRTPKNRCSCYYCKKEVSVNNLNRHLAVCSLALITFLQ